MSDFSLIWFRYLFFATTLLSKTLFITKSVFVLESVLVNVGLVAKKDYVQEDSIGANNKSGLPNNLTSRL